MGTPRIDREEEAPEDDLNAVPEALVEPRLAGEARRRLEGHVERACNFVWRGPSTPGSRARPSPSPVLRSAGSVVLVGEDVALDEHSGLEIRDRAGALDLHERVPDERYVCTTRST